MLICYFFDQQMIIWIFSFQLNVFLRSYIDIESVHSALSHQLKKSMTNWIDFNWTNEAQWLKADWTDSTSKKK